MKIGLRSLKSSFNLIKFNKKFFPRNTKTNQKINTYDESKNLKPETSQNLKEEKMKELKKTMELNESDNLIDQMLNKSDNKKETNEKFKNYFDEKDKASKNKLFLKMAKRNLKDNIISHTKKDHPLFFSSDEEESYISYSDFIKTENNFSRVHPLDLYKTDLVSFPRIMETPNNIQKAAQKIFSKYEFADIKEWSKKYMLQLAYNHAREPPLDLTKLKKIKFGNSEELGIKTKNFNDDINPNDIKPDAEILGENKKEENKINPYIRIEYSPQLAVAYLYSRMPQTYNVLIRILKELKSRNPDWKPKSVLDYGAGLGSGILSVLNEFGFDTIKKMACVEPNKFMRKLGRYLVENTHEDKDLDIVWVESLAMLPGIGGMERGKYDLIILSHVLQEIISSKAREMIIDTLYNRLSNNGVFLIVEPGSPKGYRFINDIREYVIEKKSECSSKINELKTKLDIENDEKVKLQIKNKIDHLINSENVNILAPCQHSFTCPMANKPNDWCHFSQMIKKYEKIIIPRVKKDSDLLNEKYSYLVIKKGEHIVDTINEKLNEDDLSLPELSYKWSRLIRQSLKRQKHTLIDLCTNKGTLERRIISRSNGIDHGSKIVRKVKWGELWIFQDRIPNKFRKERLHSERLW